MARTRLECSPTLLDQVCDRLAWRSRRPGRRGARPSRGLGFEYCEPRNMLAAGSIGGVKYNDPMDLGLGQPGNTPPAGSTPLGGVTINLYQDNGSNTFNPGDPLIGTQVTNALTGAYDFTGLADGRYYVQEVVPAGSTQTGPTTPATYYTVDIIDGASYSATTMTVDDFNIPNPADTYFINALNPNPTLLKESGSTSDIIGGFRDVLINVLGTANPISAEGYVGMSGGQGTFNLGTATSAPGSEATLQYSGSGSEMLVAGNLTNAMALTSTDLTDGGLNNGLRFDFDFLQSPNADVDEEITATSAGGTATFSGTIPQNTGNFSAFVPFSSFATTGTFTFSNITSLKISFNSIGTPDVDFELNRIDTADQTNTGFNFSNFTAPALSIIKTDSAGGSSVTNAQGNVLPGQLLTYTVTVSNAGPGSVTGASVTDPLPASFTSGTYTSVLHGGATDSTPSGSGNISDSVTLPSGASIVYTVIGTVSHSATAAFTNTATVTPPNGTPINAPDTDNPIVLSIIKTDSAGGSSVTNAQGNVLPGQLLTYTVTVGNAGPGSVTGASVTDPLPASFTSGTYTSALHGGATDSTPSGSGNISDSVTLPSGASIVYTVIGTVSPSATLAFTNTATVTPPNGTPINAPDTDNPIVLSIIKTDSAGGSSVTNAQGNVLPGQLLTYTVTVSNAGPGSVTGASVTDPLPASFTSGTYTSVLHGGATDSTPSGSGNISDSVTLPSGASIVYTVIGTVSPSATLAFTNTATVTPPGGTPINAPDTDNPIVLSIIKTDSAGGSSVTNAQGNVLPGQLLTYTVTVSNAGPGSVTGASVTDPLPASFTSGTYTSVLHGGATDSTPSGSGNISDSVTLPSGASIVYTVIGTVSHSATAAFTNTATVTPPNGTPINAPDTDNPIVLSIIKTDSAGGSSVTNAQGNVLPGQLLTYTVTVSNAGPGSVTGASVTDPLPASFTSGTYTSVLHGGATDSTPSGSGNISDSVTLPSGASIVYTVIGTVSHSATAAFTNTATVTPPNGTPINAPTPITRSCCRSSRPTAPAAAASPTRKATCCPASF